MVTLTARYWVAIRNGGVWFFQCDQLQQPRRHFGNRSAVKITIPIVGMTALMAAGRDDDVPAIAFDVDAGAYFAGAALDKMAGIAEIIMRPATAGNTR